jgi:uncharacterized protein (DUF4415 family)
MKRVTTLKPPRNTSARRRPDRDNPPWTEKMLGPAQIGRGRGPQKLPTKVSTTIRLDRDVWQFFRSKGAGYQTKINDTLREAIKRDRAGRANGRR